MFENVVGNQKTIDYLTSSVDDNRLAHAQLFVGPEGIGLLEIAISYAKYILCKDKNSESADYKNCQIKVNECSHPDVHYAFPVVTTETVKSKPVSNNFLKQWKEFIRLYPFGSLNDWYTHLGVEKKQGQIGVDESLEIVKKLSLKSYEGGYKIMIIWMADKMNTATANKILKILEEPPQKTVFILITEKAEDIISTITSRCQLVEFKKPEQKEIEALLIDRYGVSESLSKRHAHLSQGDVNKAIKLSENLNDDAIFEEWFVKWVRSAFRAKGSASAVLDLIAWSEEVASYGREVQKQFLHYCIAFFRQALLQNYTAKDLVYLNEGLKEFQLDKFAPFVNGGNINEIFKEISDAIYHIERNGNGKIILTDLSIKLTRLIHKK
ncbi:DNA polymerase III subunit delta' [uncultured Flavobacterium sp.]|uniref:DNA polymerase III subunit n=1 Tax=uncultured Flavobacterium sp. TaxID=165435 RepID=UPI0030CA4FC8